MSWKDNLRPLTTELAREIGAKGGKRAAESKRKKKLMSQIYGEFLAEKFAVTVDGTKQDMTGEKLVNSVVKKVLIGGGASAVSLMKEIREATEGSKVAITDPDGGPFGILLLTHEQAVARLAELRAEDEK